jgi:phage FluMu protein Com
MNELERKPYSSESMRVRCPHCRKLYLVQYSDVKESKPRFECIQCHDRFWLSLPDMDIHNEMTGIPLNVKDSPVKSRKVESPCPKCFKIINSGTAECPHCGVVIAKLKELSFQEDQMPRSETLEQMWKKVIANYGDESVHTDFLRLAQRESNLPFAALQYGQMQKLMPGDETTDRRVNEVRALGSVLMPEPDRLAPPIGATTNRFWQLPLIASVILIGVGLFVPMLRQIVGVGAALLFLALALQIQFRRRT